MYRVSPKIFAHLGWIGRNEICILNFAYLRFAFCILHFAFCILHFAFCIFAYFAHLSRMGRYDNPAKGRDCVGDVAEVMVEVAGSLVGIGLR